MTEGIADLTDKEKEALRLLLAGHDAKSSAAQLDLSVHTINDRLRNARRKLDVSSSREAARILGDAEGGPPPNLAHTTIGMAPQAAAIDNADLNNTKPKEAFGLSCLAGGMLIMSIVIAAAIIGVVYMSNETSSEASAEEGAEEQVTAEVPAQDPASLPRAMTFLGFVDAGDWNGSWEAAGEYFQSQTTADQWAAVVEPVREPLGVVNERRFATVQRASTLSNAPEGEYEVLQFQTRFEGSDQTVLPGQERLAVETVIMLAGKDGWEVVGYFIR